MLKQTLSRLIVLCVIAVPATAQVSSVSPFGAFGEKPMDPARISAMMANAQRTLKPATYVLDHKADLALTDDQVRQLELLAKGQEDSTVVRQIRLTAAMARLAKKRQESGEVPNSGWVGPINEKQLRDQACDQAALSVELAIALMRDRQAVGNILTANQIDRMPALEAADVLRTMKPKEP